MGSMVYRAMHDNGIPLAEKAERVGEFVCYISEWRQAFHGRGDRTAETYEFLHSWESNRLALASLLTHPPAPQYTIHREFFNTNPVENLFSIVKEGLQNPTPLQFALHWPRSAVPLLYLFFTLHVVPRITPLPPQS